MLNAARADFKPVFNRPMTQGPRCHQLAMYVVYEEPESLAFISGVPVEWDETRVLDARVGEYILVARRRGGDWFVGARTNWTARSLDVDDLRRESRVDVSMTIKSEPNADSRREAGLGELLLDDGRPALLLTAAALLVSGAFAVFLSIRREFLPHDVAFLGMTAEELCGLADCRVVRFMFHDRVAFGGSLIAVAILYLWLAAVPLREGARWAWRAFAMTGRDRRHPSLTRDGFAARRVWQRRGFCGPGAGVYWRPGSA